LGSNHLRMALFFWPPTGTLLAIGRSKQHDLQQQLILQGYDAMPRITELKKLIVQLRMIQADLAASTGIPETRLSRIVNGRITPKDDERKELAKALYMPTEELPV
jgi:ribosome-binding protein aMBF1 (putative translation factor)